MSFWENLKASVSEASNNVRTSINKFKNSDFADATMAICTLVAYADGNISVEERAKMARLIVSNELLQVFKPEELKQKFDHFCNKIEADADFGRIEAVQAIGKLAKSPDQARAVIQIGIVIGSSDGTFDVSEKKVIRDACLAVRINPSEFDLQA